jgi:ATP-dependent Clp protease adapter protein ClpS
MSQVVLEPDAIESSSGNGGWMVVIFNNDTTTMDEVVQILMEATHCDVEEAAIEMWEAHTFGKAAVHYAGKEECERAAAIIQTVGIETEVKKEWDD